jgi:transposase-like protein
MWWKRGQRTGRKLIILDQKPLWKDLKKLTIRQLEEKYNATRRTITFRLREINEAKYEAIVSERRIFQTQPVKPVPDEVWTLLRNGYSIRSIAKANNLHPSILHDRIRRLPEYREIINQRQMDFEHTIQIAVLQFKEGQLLQNLSKEHEICVSELASQIQTVLGPKTYNDILQQRKHNPSNKIAASTIDTAALLLQQGSKVVDICRQLNIHRKTLRRRLRQLLGNKYDKIIQRRRVPEQLIQKLARQFLNGESLNQLSKTYNIPLFTLFRRLPKTIGQDRYRTIQQNRLLYPAIGTRGAARSRYELEIEDLLRKHGIKFSTERTIEAEGHKYRPDFVLDTIPIIIIEATGMNIDAYWIKYAHKLQHFLQLGLMVIFIVPDTSVYNKAHKYVPEKFLIKLSEFKNKVESLKEAPNRNQFPTKKSLEAAVNLRSIVLVSDSHYHWVLRNVCRPIRFSFVWLNKYRIRTQS